MKAAICDRILIGREVSHQSKERKGTREFGGAIIECEYCCLILTWKGSRPVRPYTAMKCRILFLNTLAGRTKPLSIV